MITQFPCSSHFWYLKLLLLLLVSTAKSYQGILPWLVTVIRVILWTKRADLVYVPEELAIKMFEIGFTWKSFQIVIRAKAFAVGGMRIGLFLLDHTTGISRSLWHLHLKDYRHHRVLKGITERFVFFLSFCVFIHKHSPVEIGLMELFFLCFTKVFPSLSGQLDIVEKFYLTQDIFVVGSSK